MKPLEEFDLLLSQGEQVKAVNNLLQRLNTLDPSSDDARQSALKLFRVGSIDRRLLSLLDLIIDGLVIKADEDLELTLAHAQLAWIADQRDPSARRAIDSARKAIKSAPDLLDGYRILGFAYLSRGEYLDAYITFSAALGVSQENNYENFRSLSKFLMRNVSPIAFEVDGLRYKFDLTTHCAEAIESSAYHSVGLLTEMDELLHAKSLLNEKPVDSIVEVGVLMGNHSAYFLKNLSPSHLFLFDADPMNIPFIERTTAYNNDQNNGAEIEIHNAFVAGTTGTIKLYGQDVEQVTLDSVVDRKVDFLKVDVDGGELELLKGATRLIEESRPIVMIETIQATHEQVASWFKDRGFVMDRVFERGGYNNVFFRTQD